MKYIGKYLNAEIILTRVEIKKIFQILIIAQ